MGLAVLPLLLLGIVLLAGVVQGAVWYDSALFSEVYAGRYRTPDGVIARLEKAWQSGDTGLLAEVQGTRWKKGKLEAMPKVRFSIALPREGEYLEYLFLDYANYHRYIVHIKMVNGRYVVVPENLFYYVNSGRWVRTFYPIAAIWWLALILFALGWWFYRAMNAYLLKEYRKRNM
jgi:hypothetical protein